MEENDSRDFQRRRDRFIAEDSKPTAFQRLRSKIKEGGQALKEEFKESRDKARTKATAEKEEYGKFRKEQLESQRIKNLRKRVSDDIKRDESSKVSNIFKERIKQEIKKPQDAQQFSSRAESIFLQDVRLPDLTELNDRSPVPQFRSSVQSDFGFDRQRLQDMFDMPMKKRKFDPMRDTPFG